MTWSLMDTAPRDGTRVLLECEADLQRGMPHGTFVVEARYVESDMGTRPGWQRWCGHEDVRSTEFLDPLRWMPMPI